MHIRSLYAQLHYYKSLESNHSATPLVGRGLQNITYLCVYLICENYFNDDNVKCQQNVGI